LRNQLIRPATIAILGLTLLAAWAPAAPQAKADSTVADFVDVAQQSGLDWTCQHWNKQLGLGPRWFNDILMCGSPVIADFNGDGYPDVFFPGTKYSYQSLNDKLHPSNGLFLNNGDGTFTDATSFVGLDDPHGYSFAAAAVDYNNTGNLDLYVANYPEIPAGFNGLNGTSTTFFVNNGDGTFTKYLPPGLVTQPRGGYDDRQMGMSVAVADYDKDGCMDILRGNYIQYNMKKGMPTSLQLTVPDTSNLYHNNCDGTFTDVTTQAGVSLRAGRTFAVNFADFNGDGWPDVYMANDENPNELYLNNHDGTFTDFSAGSNANDPRGNMCSEPADFNNDGKLDLYMSAYENEYKGLYLGNGDGTFVDASSTGDLPSLYTILGWGCVAFDLGNAGAQSLFVADGHMLPTGAELPGGYRGYELPNELFQNTLPTTGQFSLVNVSAEAGPGLQDQYVSSGAMASDLLVDGRQDLIVVHNNNAPVALYRDLSPSSNHWLEVDLRNPGPNHFAIGAKVTVTDGPLTQTQQMITGESLGSGSVQPLHFGLGPNDGPATITVQWPDLTTQTVTVPSVDMPIRVVEGQGVQLDTLAPKVDVHVDAAPGLNGWYCAPSATVTLTATDRGVGETSGVHDLSYRVDGGPLVAYDGPFTISGQGEHRLITYATDNAGNHAWYPTWVRLDDVPPSVNLTQPQAGQVYAQDRPMGATPDGSTIVVAPFITPNSEANETDVKVAGEYRALHDQYGVNAGSPPASLGGTLGSTVGSDGLTHVTVDATDATSGVEKVDFLLDGAYQASVTSAPYEWSYDLRGVPVGHHTLTAVASDVAGNTATTSLDLVVVPDTQDGVLNTVSSLTQGASS
jgi:hypothetical protein